MGSQFSLIIIAPMVFAFMLYLAPTRRRAALVIWTTACAVALLMLFAAYFFRPAEFWQALRHAAWMEFSSHVRHERRISRVGG